MKPSYRESRVIDFQVEGSNFKGEPTSQTIYNFDIKIDEILSKPAFMVNTTSQILFPSNDRIVFGCFVAYFFEQQNEVPSIELLWDLICEAFNLINSELESRANIKEISIESPDKEAILSQLQRLIIGGFRLN